MDVTQLLLPWLSTSGKINDVAMQDNIKKNKESLSESCMACTQMVCMQVYTNSLYSGAVFVCVSRFGSASCCQSTLMIFPSALSLLYNSGFTHCCDKPV